LSIEIVNLAMISFVTKYLRLSPDPCLISSIFYSFWWLWLHMCQVPTVLMVPAHKIGGRIRRLLNVWFFLKMTFRVFSGSMAAERKNVQQMETRAHRGTFLCEGGAQRGQNLLLTFVILPVQAECCPPPLPGDDRPLLQLSKGVSLQRGG
jgi:hypothetical protein